MSRPLAIYHKPMSKPSNTPQLALMPRTVDLRGDTVGEWLDVILLYSEEKSKSGASLWRIDQGLESRTLKATQALPLGYPVSQLDGTVVYAGRAKRLHRRPKV